MISQFKTIFANGAGILYLVGTTLLIAYSIARAPDAEFDTEAAVEFPRFDEVSHQSRQASRPHKRVARPVQPKEEIPETVEVGEPDPLLRGLGAIPGTNGLMVLEANAIKHSWIFDALEGCVDFKTTDLPAGFPEDFDLMESVDRVATGDGVALVSGFFEGIDWEEAIGQPIDEANDAKVFQASEGQYFAVWDNQMMITAESREALDEVLNGLNDPSSVPPGAGLQSSNAFGDIYGKLNGSVLSKMVPEEYQDQLTPELLDTLQGIDFHVDTSQGLAMSAQVHSDNEETLKALNFVMKLALSQAQSSAADLAEQDLPVDALGLAQALKASQIGSAEDGTLNFDLALPRQVMEGFLREACQQIKAAPSEAMDSVTEETEEAEEASSDSQFDEEN